MSAGPSPVGRLRAAADTLDRLDQAATKAPWRYSEARGRDITDEGWSYLTIEAGTLTLAEMLWDGTLTGERPEADGSLIACLRSLAGPVAALLRSTADRSASGNDIPAGRGLWLEDALALADAVLASTREESTDAH